MPREVNPGWIRQIAPLLRADDGHVNYEVIPVPALADDDWFVVDQAMANGALALAHNGPSAAELALGGARNLSVTITQVGGVDDTMGTLTVVGTDRAGAALTEVIAPGAGAVTPLLKAFATVTSITQAGWVRDAGAGSEDRIKIGTGTVLGLRYAVGAAGDVILTTFNALAVAANATADGTVGGSTVDLSAGVYDGAKVATATYRSVAQAVLSTAGAATIASFPALGFIYSVEDLLFIVEEALAGAAATQDFELQDAAANVIASITVAIADGAAGTVISATSVVDAFARIPDLGTLVLKRVAGGTVFTAGTGSFVAKIRQRPQARI